MSSSEVDFQSNVFAGSNVPSPMLSLKLIDRGGVLGIKKPDLKTTTDKRLMKTAICTTTPGDDLIFVSDRGQSGLYLYELATIAKAWGCDIALNLDGGPATSLSVKDYSDNAPFAGIEIPADTGWIHPNLIVIE